MSHLHHKLSSILFQILLLRRFVIQSCANCSFITYHLTMTGLQTHLKYESDLLMSQSHAWTLVLTLLPPSRSRKHTPQYIILHNHQNPALLHTPFYYFSYRIFSLNNVTTILLCPFWRVVTPPTTQLRFIPLTNLFPFSTLAVTTPCFITSPFFTAIFNFIVTPFSSPYPFDMFLYIFGAAALYFRELHSASLKSVGPIGVLENMIFVLNDKKNNHFWCILCFPSFPTVLNLAFQPYFMLHAHVKQACTTLHLNSI